MLALGLMSGTSADGLSLALLEERGRRLRVRAHADYPYSKRLRGRILASPRASAPDLCRLNFALGRLYAQCAVRFLRAARVAPKRLAAVGSHGQTVIHLPDDREPSTLQIGEPSFLAEALDVPVVSDFRPRDMAAGGQGAPLMPFLDEQLFSGGPPRILQNIGGVANAALVGRGVRTIGFDTGPGNSLIDLAVSRITRGRFALDRGGGMARRGRVDEALARRLAREPFFLRRPPKSLDRFAFGEAYLRRHFQRPGVRPQDAVATATYFTALTIADACRRFLLPRAKAVEMIVSGGGALNPLIMDHLRRLMPVPVRSIAELGIPPLAKEPALIALMALRAVQGRPNHCPSATGARGARILGKIAPPGPLLAKVAVR